MRPRTPWDRPYPIVEQLNPQVAKKLKKDVERICRNEAERVTQSLLTSLTSKTLYFCEWELRKARKRPGEVKEELRQLRRRTVTYLKFLDDLSWEAREEVDFYLTERIELRDEWFSANEPTPSSERNADADPSTEPPPPMRSYYIDPLAEKLSGLLREIDAALSREQQSGRPRQSARLYLAYEVANAMRDELGVEPSTTLNGPFEELFGACLEAGLATIGHKEDLSGHDLRQYIRVALHKTT